MSGEFEAEIFPRGEFAVQIMDMSGANGSDPVENYRQIREELRLYDPSLIERPEVIAVTKAELPGAADVAEKLCREAGERVLSISAVTGKGLPELIAILGRELQELRAAETAAQ